MKKFEKDMYFLGSILEMNGTLVIKDVNKSIEELPSCIQKCGSLATGTFHYRVEFPAEGYIENVYGKQFNVYGVYNKGVIVELKLVRTDIEEWVDFSSPFRSGGITIDSHIMNLQLFNNMTHNIVRDIQLPVNKGRYNLRTYVKETGDEAGCCDVVMVTLCLKEFDGASDYKIYPFNIGDTIKEEIYILDESDETNKKNTKLADLEIEEGLGSYYYSLYINDSTSNVAHPKFSVIEEVDKYSELEKQEFREKYKAVDDGDLPF